MIVRLSCAAILASALALTAPASARDLHVTKKCETNYTETLAIANRVVEATPGAKVTDYSGPDAQKLIAAINAVEPVSDWTATHIIVVDTGEDAFRVGIIDHDCLTHASPVPRAVWPDMVKQALGDAL